MYIDYPRNGPLNHGQPGYVQALYLIISTSKNISFYAYKKKAVYFKSTLLVGAFML